MADMPGTTRSEWLRVRELVEVHPIAKANTTLIGFGILATNALEIRRQFHFGRLDAKIGLRTIHPRNWLQPQGQFETCHRTDGRNKRVL